MLFPHPGRGFVAWTLTLGGAVAGFGGLALAQDDPSSRFGPTITQDAPPPPPTPLDPVAQEIPEPEGMQVMTRGPVHEAFAKLVAYDPNPGIIVPKAPPAPIEELPPDQKPEGRDVQWMPGYWSWDEDRNDFIWISGVWRDVPPGRRWVPGYWTPLADGFQYVPGFWGAVGVDQGLVSTVTYLPPPPRSLEMGPSSPPPSPASIWVPGYWSWIEDRYVWRPGYWIDNQPRYVWNPPHYQWTPSGYVFVDGYWDYPLDRRGVMFAPVAFQQPVYNQPNFAYSPGVAILAGSLLNSLFARPNQQQYYFGDYYNPSYSQAGIVPWFATQQDRRGYDPLYGYYRANNSPRDPGWSDQLRRNFRYRQEHEDARPPRTFTAQRAFLDRVPRGDATTARDLVLGRPLSQVGTNGDAGLRLERLDRQRRDEMVRRVREIRETRDRRLNLEREAASRRRPDATRAHTINLPRSPVVVSPPPDRGEDRLRPVPFPPPGQARPNERAERPARAEAVRPVPAPRRETERLRPIPARPEANRPESEPSRHEVRRPPAPPQSAAPRPTVRPNPPRPDRPRAIRPEPPKPGPEPARPQPTTPKPGPGRERPRPDQVHPTSRSEPPRAHQPRPAARPQPPKAPTARPEHARPKEQRKGGRAKRDQD